MGKSTYVRARSQGTGAQPTCTCGRQYVRTYVRTCIRTYPPIRRRPANMRIRTSRTPLPSITYAGAHMSAGATELARRGFAQPSRGASGPQGGDLRSRKFMSHVRASGHKRSAPHSHHPGPGAWARGPVSGPDPRGPGPPAPGLGPRPRPQPIRTSAHNHMPAAISVQARTYVTRCASGCSQRARRRRCRRSVNSKTRKTARRSSGKWVVSA